MSETTAQLLISPSFLQLSSSAPPPALTTRIQTGAIPELESKRLFIYNGFCFPVPVPGAFHYAESQEREPAACLRAGSASSAALHPEPRPRGHLPGSPPCPGGRPAPQPRGSALPTGASPRSPRTRHPRSRGTPGRHSTSWQSSSGRCGGIHKLPVAMALQRDTNITAEIKGTGCKLQRHNRKLLNGFHCAPWGLPASVTFKHAEGTVSAPHHGC